ncbi:MAG: AMP-binding protein [Acidobacteria bacterium]|nr:AMP-binding protein [Acidobacteriota bacterium]
MTEATLFRLVADLVEAAITASRRSSNFLPRALWTPATTIRDGQSATPDGSLGADSLELLEIGAAVNHFFHLYEWGTEDNLLRRRDLGWWAEVVSATIEDQWQRLTFHTSGSTGEPKAIVQPRARLEQEAAYWAGLFPGSHRLISLVPAHHLYGFLWTVLLPERAGWPVVDARSWSPARLLHELRPGDIVVGFPFRWELIARAGGRFPEEVTLISSAGALASATWPQLTAAGAAQVLEVYGSTETGAVAWKDSYARPYRLLPYWTHNLSTGQLSREGAEEPDLPMDHLHWSSPDEFTIAGRKDQAVKVGGALVHLPLVEAAIREYPGVSACAVRPGDEDQARLKAFVVWQEGSTASDLTELSRWLGTRLPAGAVPRHYCVGEHLPMDGNGKVLNWKTQQ